LGLVRNPAHTDFVLAKLEANRNIEDIVSSALSALGQMGGPRALDRVLSYTRDPRPVVLVSAIGALGNIHDDRAYERLAEMVHAPEEVLSYWVLGSIETLKEEFAPSPAVAETMAAALLAAARDTTYSWDHRMRVAETIGTPKTRAEAYATILKGCMLEDECQGDREVIVEELGKIGPDAAAAVPVLRSLLQSPEAHLQAAARVALAKIEAGAERDDGK
jgi:HEAT repeat protein